MYLGVFVCLCFFLFLFSLFFSYHFGMLGFGNGHLHLIWVHALLTFDGVGALLPSLFPAFYFPSPFPCALPFVLGKSTAPVDILFSASCFSFPLPEMCSVEGFVFTSVVVVFV